MKTIRSLPLHLKTAFKSIKRRFGSALSSMFAVTITLLLMTIFFTIALNVDSFTKNVEEGVRIFARIEHIVDENEHPSYGDKIKAIPGVAKVEYSSKEDQFEIFISSKEGGKAYESFRDRNPLYAGYYIDVVDGTQIEDITKQIEAIDGIHDAYFGGDSAADMIKAFDSVRLGGSVFVGALCVLAVFLISNTINMNISARKDEVSIMRQVGASNMFIKIPFLLEGMIIGALGSIVPILVTIFGYGFAFDYMKGKFFTDMFPLIPVSPFVMQLSLGLLCAGMLVGLVGSLISVNKSLRWKR